ncbi:MAG: thioredoxin family protein [Hydrogenibacillus schlegelii]|nr:thioredoxin family protein [Hydrogenibacillus schlegelii]
MQTERKKQARRIGARAAVSRDGDGMAEREGGPGGTGKKTAGTIVPVGGGSAMAEAAEALRSWWDRGQSFAAYVDGMTVNRERLRTIEARYVLPEAARAFWRRFRGHGWRALILTADWCGDAMMAVPVFCHIAREAEMEARFFIRDDHPALMDRYLTGGARAIPKFVFVDAAFQERAVWGPRPPEVQAYLDAVRRRIPPPDDSAHETVKRAVYREVGDRYATDPAFWAAIEADLRRTLEPVAPA